MPLRSFAPRRLRCVGLATALLGAVAAQGGTASATFTVQINLVQPGSQPPAGPVVPTAAGALAASSYCVSATLSEQANAQVRVVCTSGEFVSIEPVQPQEFAGTHGGAHRFVMGRGANEELAIGSAAGLGAAASVTALQVFDVARGGETMEMLVSF